MGRAAARYMTSLHFKMQRNDVGFDSKEHRKSATRGGRKWLNLVGARILQISNAKASVEQNAQSQTANFHHCQEAQQAQTQQRGHNKCPKSHQRP